MEPLTDAPSDAPESQDPLLEPVYRVGAVARLANIPVETLRVWERRYGIVKHAGQRHRHRFYSVRDVRRLTLIKQLVDLGSSISTLAQMSLAELQEMYLRATASKPAARAASLNEAARIRVILVGPALQARFAAVTAGLRSVDVVAQVADLETVGAVAVHADVLVAEFDTLEPELGAALERAVRAVRARYAIVAYRFAPSELLHEFTMRGHIMQRAPLLLDSLDALCAVLPSELEVRAQQPAASADEMLSLTPRFDERTLARIANTSTDLRCECPRHVSELLLSISAFEKYSAQCASRGPEDSQLHRHLGGIAAHCRLQFEQALIYLARVEGIPLT